MDVCNSFLMPPLLVPATNYGKSRWLQPKMLPRHSTYLFATMAPFCSSHPVDYLVLAYREECIFLLVYEPSDNPDPGGIPEPCPEPSQAVSSCCCPESFRTLQHVVLRLW
ncbi:hypothetical protein EYF80_006094 [Liparis tanakae]|uniref:Uncharacterized protein n=1 Tax=Liparis tanakae TaxID=230148 RepID=A0A4Z2J077_9TELE|nr:hypothetical protein EYF80_006094 [Liparis tanakae]